MRLAASNISNRYIYICIFYRWARIDGVMYDRKTFLMNEPDGKLYCKIIFKRDDEIKQEKVTLIPFTELTTFVSGK